MTTHPKVAHDKVTFYLIRHGHRHRIGTANTNHSGTLTRSFHETPGATIHVKIKLAAKGQYKTSYSPTHRVKVHS